MTIQLRVAQAVKESNALPALSGRVLRQHERTRTEIKRVEIRYCSYKSANDIKQGNNYHGGRSDISERTSRENGGGSIPTLSFLENS